MKFDREEFERGTRQLERWLEDEARKEAHSPPQESSLGCLLLIVLFVVLAMFATSR